MQKLANVLSQIANSGMTTECLIKIEKQDEEYVTLETFMKQHKSLKNFMVVQCNLNDLILKYEIRVKEVKNVSKQS